MVKRGRFAVSNGKEYELGSHRSQYYLKSKNPYDLQNGFIKIRDSDKVFIKEVSTEELDDAYEIFPYAMVGGYRFSVQGYNEQTDTVALVTNNPFVKKKINVRPNGQHEYIIDVPHDDIEIKEDRISILGFEKNFG